MPFGLTIGTERAATLQQSIQDELTKRGYSPDADPVMAEYITIMVINNKSPAQITSELEDLIGSDYDPSFTDWLFREAAKGAAELDDASQAGPSISDHPVTAVPTAIPTVVSSRDPPPHIKTDNTRRQPSGPRSGVYQQALSQALPSSSTHKRPAPARSPSPTHPNKSRRTDVPTGPRAMLRDGPNPANAAQPSKSLLDRVGGPAGGMRNGGLPSNGFVHDDIQNRIDNIVNTNTEVMVANGYNGMDMNAMPGMANPLMLQEMMMNQMALMAQMASSIGMMGGVPFGGPAFPMQNDMGMFQSGMNGGFQGAPHQNVGGMGGRGRGGGRGGRGGAVRGRGASTSVPAPTKTEMAMTTTMAVTPTIEPAAQLTVVAPTPTKPTVETVTSVPASTIPAPPPRNSFPVPERPQSPTLCKYNLKCTNPYCRYAHPSPIATPESGVVLSNEACENGKDCQDKDCIKGHVSPSVLNPQLVEQATPPVPSPAPTSVPCRFGPACSRPGCTFIHPTRSTHFAQQCRFGTACTKATCPFQHPEGRVLPTSFHRGLATTGGLVTVLTPETGSMGSTASPHKSVKFNISSGVEQGIREKMQQQLREIEERKKEAEKAVREAEAAAASSKKDESKAVAIIA